jgi:hypothetical protein
MAIKRQLNILGQQRIDAPHLRMLESAVAADFDALAGEVLAGGRALVVKGFALATSGMTGQLAQNLQVIVGGGVLIHPLATESGSVFTVPDAAANETLSVTNAKVEGSFTAGSVNYVGIDLRREADATTADVVTFLDAVTWQETPRLVPLARTLDYRFLISTVDFSATPHVCPLAIVTTSANNTISSIVDARQMAYRLATGGSGVNNRNAFTWPQGRSTEVSGIDSAFVGGDRAIGSGKEWQDAVMTRLWELGGGERWFTANSDRDTKLCFGTTSLGNSDNFQFTLGTNTIEWMGLRVVFANSTAIQNVISDGTVAGSTAATLLNNQCLYVDVNRAVDGTVLTAQVANLATLGSPAIPGSRFVIAWRVNNQVFFRDKQYEAGRTFVNAATSTSLGTVQLSYAVTGTPIVAARADTTGTISNTAAGSNGDGLSGTGIGTGRGVLGTGGATGPGVRGVGGATSGAGVVGVATAGNSDGVQGTGVGSGGAGVFGTAVNGPGVKGVSGGSFPGLLGEAAVGGNGDGVQGLGRGVGAGVFATGGSNGAGVVGTAGGGNNNGVDGTGTGTGSGVVGSSTNGRAFSGTGGALGGMRISTISGTGAAAINSANDSLQLRSSTTSAGSKTMLSMLHAATDAGDDGIALYSVKNAEDDVDLIISSVDDGVITDILILDTSSKAIRGVNGAEVVLGTSGSPFFQVYANIVSGGALVAPPAGIILSGAGPTLTVPVSNGVGGASSYIRLNSGTSSGTISMTAGFDGQLLTIVNLGGSGTPSFATGAASYAVTTTFTVGLGTINRSISFIYDATTSKWYETGRS